jgi:DNA-directed RNA polymerase subunit M/transcription elongation factor TFIIS
MRALGMMLSVQTGPFPDDVLALMYFSRRLTANELIERCLAPPEELEPRETIRRLFVKTLMQASPILAHDRNRALELARAIEVSCFNASVRASKESEEPPRRQWDSPAFVDIYSTRCGTIAMLLNPSSSSCRAYGGDNLVQRLLGAEGVPPLGAEGVPPLSPEALGSLSEKELCPEATVQERAEIAKRSEQKVVEKESNLFRCTHCGERRCTYVEVQRRSLDEAPDYMCYCLSCSRRFTGRG